MPLWDKDRQTEGEGDRATERKGEGGVGISVPLLQILDFMSGRGGTVREKYGGRRDLRGKGMDRGRGSGFVPLGCLRPLLATYSGFPMMETTKSFTPQTEDYGVEYQDEETRNEFWLLIIAALLLGIVSAFSSTSTILYVHLKVIGI
ncbi:uncharacterized protein LOC126612516 isoform X2 [Malus sylvestris]|uniref:uncharacterized protein LOC126612516 isoform X2 n=1 Tax=Malus sylvestris TaxID=3752 RepID=UPI0021ACBF97|nr:uncharacterized protein LOC126612516 isoform X2 [Malus sylvestris]